ncbi:DegT/DnrJ/EryC1/StrS family aminotransferase [Haloarcula sp. H-GB5]
MINLATPDIGDAERERVQSVLDSGQLADGPQVRKFETEFATHCGASHAVATANGTTALHAALEGLGIGSGDRVLTTPFSFIASANAVRLAGADPVFADIDPATYTLDPDSVEQTIAAHSGAVDAIIAVHLYGLPADMIRLRRIADEHDIPLVEDAAQAHGAAVNGEPVGSLGDVACFSFYPTKNMTTGEGGMVVTDDPAVAARTERFVNHGRGDDGYTDVGHNFRMTSIAAAIGLAQLECLPEYVATRREHATILTDALSETNLTTPVEPSGRQHAYNQYTVRCQDREGLIDHLTAHDIGYGIYYPTPINEQEAYSGVTADTPEAKRAAAEVCSLPVHPALEQREVRRVAEVVQTYG